MDIILLGHIAFMACSLAVAVLIRFLKTDKINAIVGYRSPLSMTNDATWTEANRYSARIQLYASIVFCAFTAGSHLLIGGMTSFYLCSFLLAAIPISVIPLTEYNLRKKFDSNGNRLS
jgi:uncharacterized membrane protein